MNIAAIVAANNGFVYGFEPHPDTYSRCMKNINASNIKNCKVFNMGCGDVESELSMQTMLESNSGQHRIVDNGHNDDDGGVTVRVCVLDNQLSGLKKIDLIKIDVEGFELYVLKGADTLLKKHTPVLFIEIDEFLLKENGTSPEEIIQLLKSKYGYVIKNASDLKLVNEKDNFHNCHMDIICFPPDAKGYTDEVIATQQKMP